MTSIKKLLYVMLLFPLRLLGLLGTLLLASIVLASAPVFFLLAMVSPESCWRCGTRAWQLPTTRYFEPVGWKAVCRECSVGS